MIGVGSAGDTDAAFLADVAARGKGRLFFAENPATLPGIFAQETVTVARSAFVNEATRTRACSGWLELAARRLDWLTTVDGYNLSYLKEGASTALVSADEYEAPLVAFWQRGAGRSAAVSFPVAGPTASRARAWPRYSDFLQTLVRWVVGQDLPEGIGLRTRREGTSFAVDVWLTAAWEERLAGRPPRLALVEGASGKEAEVAWERIEPGHLRARASLKPGSWYRGAVQAGQAVPPFGPVNAPGSVECSMDAARLQELRTLVAATGGRERTELSTIWLEHESAAARDLRPPFLLLALACFLAEALRTRIGAGTEFTAARSQMAAPVVPEATQVGDVAEAARRRQRRFGQAKGRR